MSPITQHGELLLTELDHARLSKMNGGDLPQALSTVLDEADLIPSHAVPDNVVTMYSRFVVLDGETRTKQKLALCYPFDADAAEGFISVLSPAGTALLGRRVGTRAGWWAPDGKERFMTIEKILFQPEASGDHTT